jgi:AcrR family transcriptional regulator
MRAPSLYSYFASKASIYDVMFAQSWSQCMDEVTPLITSPERRGLLLQIAHSFAAFSVRDAVRYQLMCQRVIPGYEPSPDAYAVAVEALARTTSRPREVGIDEPRDVDLWTALLTGLIDQQIANDLGGERWLRLIDDAVDMFVNRIERSMK